MVAESLLRREGFKIITACNGLEAVRLSRELGDSLHLVILDLTMPVLSGGEAFTIMSEEFPDRPVLICSGYLVDLEKYLRNRVSADWSHAEALQARQDGRPGEARAV